MPEANQIIEPEANIDTREEWLLANIQDPAVPVQSFIVILQQLHAAGYPERAESGADLLLEVLAARHDEDQFHVLLKLRADWRPADTRFAATCAQQLIAFFKNDPATLALLPFAGFNKNIPATECLRRFSNLRRLRPQALCYEKTWGFGTVAELDAYAHQVIIDFETKPKHRMALSYAAETLELLDEKHLLARRHRDPAAFSEWLAQDPHGVVICALQSFGPVSPTRLQELMAGLLPGPQAWKKFWDSARKQLKQNPQVEFPAKRTDPLRLLSEAKSYDETWIQKLHDERDFKRILELVQEIQTGMNAGTPQDGLLKTIEDRLSFVVLGAGKLHWGLAAQAIILGRESGLVWNGIDIESYNSQFLKPDVFLETLRELPARRLQAFFAFVQSVGGLPAVELFLRLLPEMALSALGEVFVYLESIGQMPRVLEVLRHQVSAGQASCEMIYWLCRRLDLAETNGIGTPGSLAVEALVLLESRDVAGDRLKAKHQLRALFEQPQWLQAVLASLDSGQRTDFMRRLKSSAAWSAVDRGAILARILKLYPDLEVVLQDQSTTISSPATRLTSLRSYRERQTLLSKIVNEDIPQNSRDIATARSFGDLRENFEYKSARETQGLLMQRRSELETQLAAVRSSDFNNFPANVAGPGTQVILRFSNGQTQTFYILGEWDSDETLGIVSSNCKLAEALNGHRPGDIVTIPTEKGDSACTLVEVGGLPANIKAWIQGAQAG